ncbi:MFS transporter [Nonomuraea typhae]|uniref:MFS transporter n=1 Tax=Nonomuraea typhae TaxID=2603600 RepID=UPI001FE663C3|nr:MFS transporter [Nonomuraea typhae]
MITPTEARVTPARPWLVLSVVLTATFMDLIDATIVSIVLPRIQESLGADFAAAQWMLAGYSLTFALTLITGGRLGDIYGRRRIFLIGVAGFTLASIVCGAAGSPVVLIVARLVQGLMAALMVPQVLSVIVIMFEAERARAFALYGAALSLANVSGPLLGALLTQFDVLGLGWRAIFYVNVPIGLFAFVGAARHMPESRSSHPLRVDLLGIALVSVVSFALMFPLIQGRELGWPAWSIVMMVAALPGLALFAVSQRRAAAPLVPPSLFRQRSFVVGLVLLLIVFTGLASLFLVLNYGLQLGLGWSLIATALTGLGWPIGITLTSGIAQRFAATHGRLLIIIGLLVMTAGMVVLIMLMESNGTGVSYWTITLPMLGMGLGMGLCVSILTNVILADVPPDSAGAGSGVLNAVLQLGAAIGIAVVGALFAAAAAGGTGALLYSAASDTLWYNAAAFLVAAVLAVLLPRTARGAQG